MANLFYSVIGLIVNAQSRNLMCLTLMLNIKQIN